MTQTGSAELEVVPPHLAMCMCFKATSFDDDMLVFTLTNSAVRAGEQLRAYALQANAVL